MQVVLGIMRSRGIGLAASLLFGLIILQPAHVFAATYDSTWFIYQEGDRQKRRFAEIQVTYTFPDRAKAGRQFEVDVSLTYLKNEKAFIQWLDFYNVTVHVRKSGSGPSLVSDTDSSRVKVVAGEQYAHKFGLMAPQELGEYFVALSWKTYNPQTTAYGLRINDDVITWDTGEDEESLARVTVEKAETILTLRLENVPAGSAKVDGQDTAVLNGTIQLKLEGQHSVEVPNQVELTEGARAVFDKWSDGDTSNPRQVTLENDLELVAVYRVQYLLSLASDHGNPQGAGWYDAGSEAAISVTSPQPDALAALGGRFIFQAWTGDVTSDSPMATVTMDGPKTVRAEWRTDDSQAYMILGGIAAAIIVIIAVIALTRRRGRVVQEMASPPPPQQATKPAAEQLTSVPPIAQPLPPPAPVATQVPTAPPGMKFCMFCRRLIPLEARFCTDCRRPQQ